MCFVSVPTCYSGHELDSDDQYSTTHCFAFGLKDMDPLRRFVTQVPMVILGDAIAFVILRQTSANTQRRIRGRGLEATDDFRVSLVHNANHLRTNELPLQFFLISKEMGMLFGN